MQEGFWKTHLQGLGLSLIIEIGLAYVVAEFVFENGNFQGTIYVLLFFWAAQLIIWLKNTAVTTLIYYVWGKRRWVEIVEREFEKFKMPIYGYADDAESYFIEVINDKRSTKNQLISASANLGQINLIRLMSRSIYLLRLMAVFNLAYKNYRRRFAHEKSRLRDGYVDEIQDEDNEFPDDPYDEAPTDFDEDLDQEIADVIRDSIDPEQRKS